MATFIVGLFQIIFLMDSSIRNCKFTAVYHDGCVDNLLDIITLSVNLINKSHKGMTEAVN